MLHSVMPYGIIFASGNDYIIGQPSCFEADEPPRQQTILSTDPAAFLKIAVKPRQ